MTLDKIYINYENGKYTYKEPFLRLIDSTYILDKNISIDNSLMVDYNNIIKQRELIRMLNAEEYKEPKVDWSKVPVDAKILDFYIENNWVQRHFAKYENGIVYVWNFGRTSWSAEDKYDYYPVKNAKLVEED